MRIFERQNIMKFYVWLPETIRNWCETTAKVSANHIAIQYVIYEIIIVIHEMF